MKKTSLLKLYEMLPKNKENITESLPLLLRVRGNAEEVLFKLVEDNDDYIFDENIDDFIEFAIYIGGVKNHFYRKLMTENAVKLMHNELIRDYCLQKDVIDQVSTYMQFNYWEFFENSDDMEFYPSFVLNEFTKFFEAIEGVEEAHEFDEVFDASSQIICDLNNTESKSKFKSDEDKLKRISTFFEVASDKNVYDLQSDKFYQIMEAAKMTASIDELKKLKYVARFYGNKSFDEFCAIVDSVISDVTPLTLDIIYRGIDYKRQTKRTKDGAETTYNPKPKHPERLDKVLQKILNKDKNS